MAFGGWWWAAAVGDPEQSETIGADELALLRASAPAAPSNPRKTKANYGALLAAPALWAIFLSHAAFNFGTYFLTSWQPTYYTRALGVAPEHAAWAFACPPAANLAVKVFVNPALEALLRRRGASTLACRL